jgi:cytoskeletal protein CcmA (bactofilin family)
MPMTSRQYRPPTTALNPSGAWTLIGPGSLVRGELLLTGDVLLHGRLEGTLFTDGEVRVMASGSVDGGVHAVKIVVEGTCRGRLEATQEVILRPGSLVQADIDAGLLTIDDGARFAGDLTLGEGRPQPRVVSGALDSPGRA